MNKDRNNLIDETHRHTTYKTYKLLHRQTEREKKTNKDANTVIKI